MTPPKPSSKARHTRNREETETRLIEAGRTAFSRHGFHGATTKMIAELAEVNESLIMRYFRNKEGLYLSVIENTCEGRELEIDYPPQETLEKELIAYAGRRFRADVKNHDFIKISISHALLDEGFVKRARSRLEFPPSSPKLYERLERLRLEGKIVKGMNLETVMSLVIYQIFSVTFFQRFVFGQSEEECLKQLKLAMRTLARGLSPQVEA